MLEFYVETNRQLKDLCSRLKKSNWLAIDTEFIRENTYYPELCLLQVANESLAACIDPLAIDDLSDLAELIYNPNVVKVLHAARQDLEIFYHRWTKIPPTVFDTQLAATLSGLGDQPGYAASVKAVLGIELDKAQVRTDWRKRPLDELQIRYALNDVIYLGRLYQKMIDRLSSLGRENWLDDDFRTLTDPATYENPPDTQWKRVRGRQKLRRKQLMVLKQLAAWRENRAVKRNKPRQWILSNDNLLHLAKAMPSDLSQLMRVDGLDKKSAKRFGDELLALIKDAGASPPEEWPDEAERFPKLTLQQEALADLLMCSLKVRAAKHDINPTIIASRRDIEKLAAGDRGLEVLSGWRRKVVGGDLLRVLEGKMCLEVSSGHIDLIELGAEPGK